MQERSVLVIEDDDAVRLALEVFLAAEEGVGTVLTASNGTEGIQRAASFMPDVIVTDSTMSGVSGKELGLALRSSCPNATIVLFSGLAQTASWADHAIQKGGPETFDALAAAVSGGEAPQEEQHHEADPRRKQMHDLRNALAPIAGYASLLEVAAETLDPDQIRSIAQRLARSVERVNRELEGL